MTYRANRGAGSVGASTATQLIKDRNGEGAGQGLLPGAVRRNDQSFMEYTRSPSRLEERTFRPSFFFRWPLIKPRTL